jgi:iron(III) transport system permease protein
MMDFTAIKKEQFVWIGSIIVFMLLIILPFYAPLSQGTVDLLTKGDFSGTLWNVRNEAPAAAMLLPLLLVSAILAMSPIRKPVKLKLSLTVSLLGLTLYIVQVVLLTPELKLTSGAFILFFTFLILLAVTLSRMGIIRGDPFISGSILGIGALLVIFIILPLLVILARSVVVESSLKPGNFIRTLVAYPSTMRILKNSILMAGTVGVLSTVIGLAFALVVERSRFRLRRFMQGFSLLPIITPPFVIGLAIIFMFGRVGWFTSGILGLRVNFVFGYFGIVLAQTLSFAPMAFLILSGVIRSLDSALEEASYTLGSNRWHSFKTIIWPLIRPGLANAFLLSVIESLADFGNPILLGGDFDVLATSIYLAIVGRYDEMLAACLGLVLLSITLTTFIVQRYWVGSRSYVTVTGKPSRNILLPLPKGLDYTLLGGTLIWIVLTVTLYGSVVTGSFVKLWGISHEFTLQHYKYFLQVGLESYVTTLKLAGISAPITAAMGLMVAYLVSRYTFFGKKTFEFTSMLSFAIPGTIIGIGYVMSFNTGPLFFTGTAMILIICFVFRNMPVGIRSGMAALQQIDVSLEEASITLGASNFHTLRKVVLPLIKPAIFSGLVFAFVRSMTAISAVIFLVTAKTKLATTVILGRIEGGKLGIATAYCTVLIVTMMLAIGIMYFLINRTTKQKISIAV